MENIKNICMTVATGSLALVAINSCEYMNTDGYIEQIASLERRLENEQSHTKQLIDARDRNYDNYMNCITGRLDITVKKPVQPTIMGSGTISYGSGTISYGSAEVRCEYWNDSRSYDTHNFCDYKNPEHTINIPISGKYEIKNTGYYDKGDQIKISNGLRVEAEKVD